MKEQLDLLLQYLYGVWHRRRWIIITAWVICPLGWVAVTFMPNQYTSDARVYADTKTILQPLLRGIAIDNDPSQELRLMVKTLLSRKNLETIARYTDADVKTETQDEYEDLLENLKKKIKINSAGKENLFKISYSGGDPKYVKDVVQAALDVFVENAVGQKKDDTEQANEFIESQLADYEKRLIMAEANLAEFKRANAGYMPGSEGGYFNMAELKRNLETTRLELKEARSRLASARDQLNREIVELRRQGKNNRTEYDDRIDILQARLDALLFRFTEKHPDVRETRRQIEELQILKRGAIAVGGNVNNDSVVLQEMKLIVSEMENQVASLVVREEGLVSKIVFIEDKLSNLPAVEAELTHMMRNYDVTKSQYNLLLSRRESAMISQNIGASSDQISFRIIDPPLLPREPSGPMRPLFLTVVLILALGAGVFLAFMVSQIWPVVISPMQLFKHTKVPVFGVVSATEISGLKQVKRKQLKRYVVLCGLLLVTFIGFMVINTSPSIHEMILEAKEAL
ncbi:lipopolysaccharide biosynthesis chain length determinant protein [Photobacterium aphoticum]|uniref:Lipopolysaccharide biosynthesis chain length determinant protein n=1 Tax=Photobacterium aphoticum TaxID=754436 RepID=A0A090QQ12_9GAMM|nr:lipopolysaccharide biosynthesis chain length determinant protein [Photobacterium aphoticum]